METASELPTSTGHKRTRRRIIIRRRLTMAERMRVRVGRMRARLGHATRRLLAVRPRYSLKSFLLLTSLAVVSLGIWKEWRDDYHASRNRVYAQHQAQFWNWPSATHRPGDAGLSLVALFASTRPQERATLIEMVKKSAAEGKWNHFAAIFHAAAVRVGDDGATMVLEAYLDSDHPYSVEAGTRYKDAAMEYLTERFPILFDVNWSKDRRDAVIVQYKKSR